MCIFRIEFFFIIIKNACHVIIVFAIDSGNFLYLLERISISADDEENSSATLEWRIPIHARGASSTWEDTHWGYEQEEEL